MMKSLKPLSTGTASKVRGLRSAPELSGFGPDSPGQDDAAGVAAAGFAVVELSFLVPEDSLAGLDSLAGVDSLVVPED
jgi:hypothetical protein